MGLDGDFCVCGCLVVLCIRSTTPCRVSFLSINWGCPANCNSRCSRRGGISFNSFSSLSPSDCRIQFKTS